MALLYDIKIIDTKSSDRELSFEKTEEGSPRLVFNGTDTKYQNLITSELQFNMLVPIKDESYFFHLFTGSETRYKVIVEIKKEDGSVDLFWQGFLLPEQFQEPYDHSGFFVEFIASDGIGRLKRKYLDEAFYNEKKSVIDILIACLNRTGLFLDLWFAPAFQQLFFELNYTELQIETSVYNDSGKKKSAYDILVDLLVSIGCRLFQFKGRWVIVGLNEFAQDEIEFFEYRNNYLEEIEFQGKSLLVREKKYTKFFDGQLISVEPLLNEVIVDWDSGKSENIIPKDSVTAFPLNFEDDINDRTPRYWNLVSNRGIDLSVLLSFYDSSFDYSSLNFDNNYNGLIATPNVGKDIIGPYLVFRDLVPSKSDLDGNYATLSRPYFIEGSDDLERYATLIIEFEYSPINDSLLSENIKAGLYDGVFHFAVTRKSFRNSNSSEEEIVVSNLDYSNLPEGVYDFVLTSMSSSQIKGELKIDKLLLKETGWYNIRLYPGVEKPNLVSSNLGLGLVYTKCEFILNHNNDDKVSINRFLSFTTIHNETLYHSADVTSFSKRRFELSDEIGSQIVNSTLFPVNVTLIPNSFNLEVVEYLGNPYIELLFVSITRKDFNFLKNGYTLYVRKQGATVFEKVNEVNYSVVYNSDYGGECILQRKLLAVNSQELFIEEGDDFEIRFSSSVYSYSDYYLDKWRLSTDEEVSTYLDVFAKMYLKLRNEVNVKISGVCIGIFSPMDIIRFNYQGLRDYNLENLTIDLTRNQSEVVLIEKKIGGIADSVDYEIEVIDGGSSIPVSIAISSTYNVPSVFGSYVYFIETSYTITGINQVDAFLYHRKLQNYNGSSDFEYTGEEEIFPISVSQGESIKNYGFNLSSEDEGWYEIEMVQGSYSSNKQYVHVISNDTTQNQSKIQILKIDTDVVLNEKGRYSVNFLDAYTPVELQQVLQKFNVKTQSFEGSKIIKDLSLSSTEFVIEFPYSGVWKVFVQSVDQRSNELSWISIQG